MKHLFIGGLFVLALLLGSQEGHTQGGLIGTQQFTKTNTATATPVALAGTGTLASKITIVGGRTARTANTGDVYIGPTSTNDAQPIKIASGETITLIAPPGEWIDLADWYLDVTTANDGVVVVYTQ